MQKWGLVSIVVGLLCILGGIGRIVYAMASAFAAAHEAPTGHAAAAVPAFSLGTPLTVTTVGLALVILGGALLLGGNRSDR